MTWLRTGSLQSENTLYAIRQTEIIDSFPLRYNLFGDSFLFAGNKMCMSCNWLLSIRWGKATKLSLPQVYVKAISFRKYDRLPVADRSSVRCWFKRVCYWKGLRFILWLRKVEIQVLKEVWSFCSLEFGLRKRIIKSLLLKNKRNPVAFTNRKIIIETAVC